jgi:hypothetical protein
VTILHGNGSSTPPARNRDEFGSFYMFTPYIVVGVIERFFVTVKILKAAVILNNISL